ncbi:lantibiotic dehydratase C-terminal domain-containing protein [Micromonospora carbonacea]|uniref:Thiopeptide-type bacteriocin biosynthesis domain-containing protein n=1 Tax=Micromonospora carbonacea TaxID=47853 RepID=A0A1C4YSH6_9ACTN|nr:lantibiotic dehydratase C-terminal domain-containing protein [Micromonospora carbonacea]SCF23606.1 thiopeptide-type bacteriocin biosynthesis domain-containing protein [Micromonospora carbonacea]
MTTDKFGDLTVNVPWSSQEDLLLDVAAPTLDESVERGETESWFYLRETKESNSYLRLKFRTRSPSVEARLRARISEAVGEAGRGNLFEYRPYNKEHDWLGGPAALHIAESFWTDTTPLAVASLRETRGNRALRMALAFDMLACSGAFLATRLPESVSRFGYRAGYLSYLATFEGYMLLIRDPEKARERHVRRYELNRDALRPRLRRLMEIMREPDGNLDGLPEPTLRYMNSLRSHLPAVQKGFDEGRFYLYATPRKDDFSKLTPAPDGLYRRPDLPWLADAPEPPVAGIHRAIADNPYYQGMIREDRRFQASRVAQAYGHWHLFRLGFLLSDRYTLCYLVARSFEEEFGLDAAELIRSVQPGTEVR